MNGIYCWQDCLATIPPYPYYIGERGAHYDAAASISDPDSMWIVRTQPLSSSSRVLCAPPTQSEVATTSMQKTFLSTWSSSVPLRIFSCEQLELWSQMELESCMNRRLSPLSMLAGWKTFLGGCHCFLAFLMATQHQLFHTSTLLLNSRAFGATVWLVQFHFSTG